MNKDEQEAILHFQKYENKLVYEINEKDKRYAKTLLNLISKLQNKANKLLIDYKQTVAELAVIKKENEEYSKQLDLDYVDKNFVSKDKIKDKIKELEEEVEEGYLADENVRVNKAIIEVLEDLLKESDIE